MLQPIGGGQIHDDYSWTQNISDVTITKTIASSPSPSPKVHCSLQTRSLTVTVNGSAVLEQQFPHEIDVPSSNWSIESGELLIDLYKKIPGFWEQAFVDAPSIDIKTLGPKVGDVGKKVDLNEPVKIEDPEMIAKVAQEHPELASGLAANMASKSGNESLVTTKTTSATFTGNSSFSW